MLPIQRARVSSVKSQQIAGNDNTVTDCREGCDSFIFLPSGREVESQFCSIYGTEPDIPISSTFDLFSHDLSRTSTTISPPKARDIFHDLYLYFTSLERRYIKVLSPYYSLASFSQLRATTIEPAKQSLRHLSKTSHPLPWLLHRRIQTQPDMAQLSNGVIANIVIYSFVLLYILYLVTRSILDWRRRHKRPKADQDDTAAGTNV